MLELWNDSPKRKIGKMSLYNALRDHIRPGLVLAPLGDDKYSLVDVKSSKPQTRVNASKGQGAKILHLHTANERGYVVVVLKRAWHFLSSGLACEIHVKAARDGTKAKSLFDSKARRTGVAVYNGKEVGQFDWKSTENLTVLDLKPVRMLHFRPEVIFKAMPEGVTFAVTPIANFEEYIFALAPEGSFLNLDSKDRTRNLMKVVAKNTGRRKQIAKEEMIKEWRQHIGKDEISWKPKKLPDGGSSETPPLGLPTKAQLSHKPVEKAGESRESPRRQQIQATLEDLRAERSQRYRRQYD